MTLNMDGNQNQGHAALASRGLNQLDAGVLFVLKSKGSWLHCGYHLTTSIVAPALLSLPFAMKFLGWGAGMFCLIMAAVVTFYSYNLLSLVLEHHAKLGNRQLRFRDMAHDILGPAWARFYIAPLQFSICFAAPIGSALLGGQSMKSLYLVENPEGTMKLYEFVIIFGVFLLVLAQVPSFHNLRHINLVSLFLSLAYSACAITGSIHAGHSSDAPMRDYSLPSENVDRVFDVFNAISIIATTYGSGIIPEIQATAAPPVTGKMFKGLCLCYSIVVTTFFSVAASGYWAFGNRSQAVILSNFIRQDGTTLVPKWFFITTNVFVILELGALAVIYMQPINEVLEVLLSDPTKTQYSARNVVPRLISRSLAIVIATLVAAMIPFFGDMNAVVGAFGFLPLDFAVPAVFYNLTFRPSKRQVIFWLNTAIAIVFSLLSVLGSIAAVRQIVLDSKTYKLFANL